MVGDFVIPSSFLFLHSLILLSFIFMFLPSSSVSVYTSLSVPSPFFVSYCLSLFVPFYFFSSFLPFTIYFLPSHVFYVSSSASAILSSFMYFFVSTMFVDKLCILCRSSLFSYVVSPVPVSAGW